MDKNNRVTKIVHDHKLLCHTYSVNETEEKEELNLITLAQEYSDEDKARGQTNGERMETAIGMVTGKRLTYRQAV